ncbi:C-terminal divergent BTB domain-containing protein [Acanthamoeba polyphaga mimivirus]|uniref:C-terminal divergent BTB domain-containing protein n=1 Tax=Acanthamoeba polyphaga mimivirus Kroon TaxID=3069720 RepID=A0A0G2Y441_9VIRU|nr:C-terminal divergent BTB domain-containing protein [Acanthamoeba polyphaga mimivirus]AKI80568.1 C-terminal divergent BTB domain-containing protein [Acanthamoeba polyphaga mimivirus Kroon]
MDSQNYSINNFKQMFDNDILSDVKLILRDDKKQLSLNLHKIVLYKHCKFFQAMFVGFGESSKKEIILSVQNVDICQDIIKEFYGFESLLLSRCWDWKYQLEYHICCNYFLIDNKFPDIINVDRSCFDDLLDLIDKIDYNDTTIRLLAKTLPLDYDLSRLPVELVEQMKNKSCYSGFIFYGNESNMHPNEYNLYISDENFDNIRKFRHGINLGNDYCYISNSNKFIRVVSNYIASFDLQSESFECHKINTKKFNKNSVDGHKQYKIKSSDKLEKPVYDSLRNEVIVIHRKKKYSIICVLDSQKFNLVRTICEFNNSKEKLCHMTLSHDCNKLVFVLTIANEVNNKNTEIYVKYLDTGIQEKIYKTNRIINDLKFLNNDVIVFYGNKNNGRLKIYDISQHKKLPGLITPPITNISICQEKYVLVATNKYTYVIGLYITVIKSIENSKVVCSPSGKIVHYGNSKIHLTNINDHENYKILDSWNINGILPVDVKYDIHDKLNDYLDSLKKIEEKNI